MASPLSNSVEERSDISDHPGHGAPESNEHATDSESDTTSTPTDNDDKEHFAHYYRIKFNCYCNYCNKFFDCRAAFLVHSNCYRKRRVVEFAGIGFEMDASMEKLMLKKCEICSLQLSNMANLRIHMLGHFPRTFVCTVGTCDYRAVTNSAMRTHLKSRHKIAINK